MKVGNNLISFNINGYEFISRLLEGEFVITKKPFPQSISKGWLLIQGSL